MPFKIKETILGISIAIVLMLFIIFGISAFYKEKKYDDFCQGVMFDKPYPFGIPREYNASLCKTIEDKNSAIELNCTKSKGAMIYETDLNGCRTAKECSYCTRDYNDFRNIYNRNVFIIAGILGIITIIIAAILKQITVSSGILGGGVLIILYGTIRYWSELGGWARFIITGIALVILIWIGYKKLNEKPEYKTKSK